MNINKLLKFKAYKAQGMVEWGLVVLTVTVVCMTVVLAFGPKMKAILQIIQNALNATS